MLGLFMSEKAVCFGVRDEGGYFEDDGVRKIWENKEKVESSVEISEDGFGRGLGQPVIYHYSDAIRVDTEKGIIYCLVNVDKFK